MSIKDEMDILTRSMEAVSLAAVAEVVEYVAVQPIKMTNSEVAKRGNKAEDILCIDAKVQEALSTFFGKKIKKINKITGCKKADNRVIFEDDTTANLQVKCGTGGGRGWSCDRRPLERLTADETTKILIGNVCLKAAADRPIAVLDKTLIAKLILGEVDEYKPNYFVHVDMDTSTNTITELSICSADTFIETIVTNAYDNYLPKRTCVHLSPLLYLQRKGGGSKDHAPDHIQLKLCKMPDCMTSLVI